MTQKLRVRIPVGFAMVVQESFQSPDGNQIFVFSHIKTKKKLYCKLCSIEDLKRGMVWEVLSLNELETLEIQESYNAEMQRRTEYIVEESASGDLWDPLSGETIEEWKKRTGRKGNLSAEQLEELARKTGTVNIHIGGQNEGEGKSKEELEAENEDMRNKLTLLGYKRFEQKKKELGCNDPTITNPEQLREWEKTKNVIRDADPTSRGSSGSLTLQSQTNTGAGMTFDSQIEMIQFLQRRIHSPKSSLQEKREAQAVKDELWRKLLRGKKGKAKDQGFDPIQDEGAPLFQKFYDEWRRREKGED